MKREEIICLLGKMLKDIRVSAGVSRKELAKQVGCKYDEIRLYETGERIMRVDRLFQILCVLGVPLPECLTDSQAYEAVAKEVDTKSENLRMVINDVFTAMERAGEGPQFRERAGNEA